MLLVYTIINKFLSIFFLFHFFFIYLYIIR